MPAYDVASSIAQAVGSVLGRATATWSSIVVDDGSTDGTRAILDDLADADGRLRVLHQANSGPNAARNLAIAHATGEFLTFLDGDDVLLPGAYERMVRSLPHDRVRLRAGVVRPHPQRRAGAARSVDPPRPCQGDAGRGRDRGGRR